MQSYKTVFGFLKHLAFLAKHQDMMDCTDWDKLTKSEQDIFYSLLAGIQNDLGEMQIEFDSRNANIEIWRG